jgi:lysyl-tRNA synthetase class I
LANDELAGVAGMNVLAAFLYVRGLVPEHASHEHIQHMAQQVHDCFQKLMQDLQQVSEDHTEEQIQSIFYEAGKLHYPKELRFWFRVLYQTLLRQDDGPRLGQFTKIMTAAWIETRILQVLEDPWGVSCV